MQIDGMERHDAQEMDAGHNHTRDPEENNIVAGLQNAGWVVATQIMSIVRPAQGAEWPEPGAEPGIQNIGVLMNAPAAAVSTDRRIFTRDRDLATSIAVPGRDPVSPPQLTRNIPVAYTLQPLVVDLGKALRDNLQLAIPERAKGTGRQRRHLDKPLSRNQRLDDSMAALAMAERYLIILGLFQQSEPLKLRDNALSRREAVLPSKTAGRLSH